jgi:tight adherence protein B
VRLLAVALGVAAVVLALPPPARLPAGPERPHTRPPIGSGIGSRLTIPAASVAGALALPAILAGRRLVLALIVLVCMAGAGELVRRSRQARAAERRQGAVVEVCEALVGELRAGQPLVSSLEHCVEVWPDLEPVLAAARLGADVPAAMRRLSRLPGAEAMAQVAAAWQVAQTSGAGLAGVLTQVARSARAVESTRHLVRGELASAQATARLVAVLPLGSLAMSAGIGGRPWHFLLDTWPGLACLALGCAAAFAGLVWIDRIAVAVLRGGAA